MVEIRDGGRSLLFGLFWEHIKYLFSVSIKDSKPGERLETGDDTRDGVLVATIVHTLYKHKSTDGMSKLLARFFISLVHGFNTTPFSILTGFAHRPVCYDTRVYHQVDILWNGGLAWG